MDAKRCEPPEADRLCCIIGTGSTSMDETSEAAVAEASKSFSHPTSGAGRLQEGP